MTSGCTITGNPWAATDTSRCTTLSSCSISKRLGACRETKENPARSRSGIALASGSSSCTRSADSSTTVTSYCRNVAKTSRRKPPNPYKPSGKSHRLNHLRLLVT